MIIRGWQNIDEIVAWCVENVGDFIWTNRLTDWVGVGWTISRVQDGFKLRVERTDLQTLAVLRWS